MIQSNDLPSAESVSGASYRDYAPVDSRDRSSLLHSGLTQPSLTCPRIIYRTPIILESRADDCRRTFHDRTVADRNAAALGRLRSEEHTSELQSLMRSSYAVFCWKKKTHTKRLLIT